MLAITATRHAHDLVQDIRAITFIRTGSRPRIGPRDRRLLHVLLMNHLVDQCRSARGRRPVGAANEAEDAGSELPPDQVPAWAEVSASEFHAAVDALEPGVREVFRLRIVDRLSYRAIAERIGVPIAIVGTRLTGARTGIRRALARRPAAESTRENGRA